MTWGTCQGEAVAHTATPIASAGPAPSQSSLLQPGACRAHTTAPDECLCLDSGQKESIHPSGAPHVYNPPNSQYDPPAAGTAITFPGWDGSRQNMGFGCLQVTPAAHHCHGPVGSSLGMIINMWTQQTFMIWAGVWQSKCKTRSGWTEQAGTALGMPELISTGSLLPDFSSTVASTWLDHLNLL